ncbi:MAG: ABC transporter substrate-binding protein, partial [Proteobacteria bacterium]|nr:ABC transporter substrate-binding protein [Pseudomonadota bacterium]
KDKPKPKYVWVIWAGKGGPIPQLISAGLDKYGIEIASGGNVLAELKMMKPLKGMEGSIYYYYENPKNEVNDWLVKEHYKRFNEPPDFFTCGGFAAAGAVVTAIQKAGSTDTEKLISAMEGMEFMTPKGKMKFRKEDHQALQSMYAFKLDVKPDVAWAIPVLVKELSMEETAPPIMNKK